LQKLTKTVNFLFQMMSGLKMTAEEVILKAIPGATEALCEHIFWARTSSPFVQLTTKTLFKAAARWRRAELHGLTLCEFCDRLAVVGDSLCPQCRRALSNAKQMLTASF
jgi:hypothetical protein